MTDFTLWSGLDSRVLKEKAKITGPGQQLAPIKIRPLRQEGTWALSPRPPTCLGPAPSPSRSQRLPYCSEPKAIELFILVISFPWGNFPARIPFISLWR